MHCFNWMLSFPMNWQDGPKMHVPATGSRTAGYTFMAAGGMGSSWSMVVIILITGDDAGTLLVRITIVPLSLPPLPPSLAATLFFPLPADLF